MKEFEFLNSPLKFGASYFQSKTAYLSAPSYHAPDFQYPAQWNELVSLTSFRGCWFMKWSQALNVSCFCFPSLLSPLSFLPILHPWSSCFQNNWSRGEGTGNTLYKWADQMSPHWSVVGRIIAPEMPMSNSPNLWTCYLNDKRDFAGWLS